MKSNRWDDAYARRARDEKWLARSVYKLQEIDSRFKLMRRGSRVLDLGCYPGSWCQYALGKVGPGGDVVGIDLKRPTHLTSHRFRFIQADVMALEIQWLVREISLRDLVMSDLAPPTSGIRAADESRSLALAERAAEIGGALLKNGGQFLCKIFEGGDLNPFKAEVSSRFRQVRLFRPKATRKRSREVYLIGEEFRD
ncbi:MAG: rRNA (uridine2552-2-O)-methyltransferase [Thermodesulfobacteriota bacterium]|nr:rRNA (uridine2552-2-O)-methyltransferase [Thermodesulfobacteriota bacterium]